MTTVDITSALRESVKEAMKSVGLPDTPKSRIEVLNGMHVMVFSDGKLADTPILRAIEDELIGLQELL